MPPSRMNELLASFRMNGSAALLLALAFCGQVYANAPRGIPRDLARERASRISNVRYKISFSLEPHAPVTQGSERLDFVLRGAGPLLLDFRDGKLETISVNGKPLGTALDNGHIELPAAALRQGQNTVEAHFLSNVAPAGKPLTRFEDRDDGSEYIYTLFVPMDASMAFPCFDQPDIKGRFHLTLATPSGWMAISNTSVQRVEARGGEQQTIFGETRPISTYLFAFAAGPFRKVHDTPGLPGLYVRKSQFQRARNEAPEVQEIAAQGIQYFSSYFAQPFPFPKYDMVLIPGFAYGGMEHAGSTFLREESVLFRTAVLAHLGGVNDVFTRALLWGSLWDSVREADLAPRDYLDLSARLLPNETDLSLVQSILGNSTTALHRYVSGKTRAAFIPQFEAMTSRRMLGAAAPDLRILWFRGFRSLAETPEALAKLKSMLDGRLSIPGVQLRPLDRWTMVTALVALDDPQAPAVLAAERKRDPSGDGRKYAYVAEAAVPNAQTKKKYFDEYLHDPSRPEDWIELSLRSFNYWNQSALTQPYLKPALEALPQIKRDRKIFFLVDWLDAFIDGQHSPAADAEVREYLSPAGVPPGFCILLRSGTARRMGHPFGSVAETSLTRPHNTSLNRSAENYGCRTLRGFCEGCAAPDCLRFNPQKQKGPIRPEASGPNRALPFV